MKILLVDDETLLGETLRELLELVGHEVFYTDHARKAQDILRERGHEIELAIVDVILPEISGPELVVWIRKHYPHIRILCITGYTPTPEPEPCGSGVPVLFKPFGLEELKPYLMH
ncbi:response regulator [Thermosulfurimonas sp. F29]|uniref:response regulator n=1 Tax=Thermosulfurimonas sp. F29 TaxID=2867247 RepID=UPI001C83650A|nr:response regulator [Thermosulfurimonas sp. F29]MBX6423259.1 response regulator [Thermosulfurimonas sp. F29]